ncbi:putative phospholipid hydroperoxide glutathione peroxidase 6, mitochondrial [Coccomyxa viridis]|uniref:Glutathione peroxidase n=1 Tax=Coccomyxa viridis TaxID=1274662 RepID=A0AAV1HZH3_9CHLO|nr:putative phospholipid hydroperoxide glutathione peroxidase 6, mitochondrial [Coccomyxa viridis]
MYAMHSVSRQAVCTFSAAFRVSSAPPRRCAVSQVRELQTARQSYLGASSALKQSVVSRKSGASYLPVMALFGATATMDTLYDYTVKDADGRDVKLSQYKGKVILVVNVASQCGFTPQYKELAELDSKYKSKGLVILGFPCNQFGGQEPGSNAEVKKFAQARGAKFPIMAKVDVNGSKADPVFSFLKSKQGGLLTSDLKWNFTKFLVSREGDVVKRYGSTTTPLSIEEDIKQYL